VYTVALKPAALKQFNGLPKKDAAKVAAKIDALAINPHPIGSKKLKGSDGIYRVRFGDYRVVYLPPDDAGEILILKIAKRDEVYKLL
jgi:mRNA interferase RelE/StbE